MADSLLYPLALVALSLSAYLAGRVWVRLWTLRLVAPPPGRWLLGLADLLCSPKTRDRILRPILADMQAEVFDALGQGRPFKAVIARIRGCLAFWKALGLHTLLKAAGEVWRAVRGA